MLPLIVPGLLIAQSPTLTNDEVFSRIPTCRDIHLEMENGFFEFRIYRCATRSDFFLLEYLSAAGKRALFKCSSDMKTVRIVNDVQSGINNLEKKLDGVTYRYVGSQNAYFLDE